METPAVPYLSAWDACREPVDSGRGPQYAWTLHRNPETGQELHQKYGPTAACSGPPSEPAASPPSATAAATATSSPTAKRSMAETRRTDPQHPRICAG